MIIESAHYPKIIGIYSFYMMGVITAANRLIMIVRANDTKKVTPIVFMLSQFTLAILSSVALAFDKVLIEDPCKNIKY